MESMIVLVALLVAFNSPGLGNTWFKRWECRLDRLARRPLLPYIVILVVALGGRAALLPVEPAGIPNVQDEFSYLLMANTFASGRLTNPTHPMWIHFESLQIIHQPTYQSKYPVAQGFAIAGGMLLGGHPWVGVWLSCGLMCIAVYWMLRGWLPPGWAFLGGMACVFRIALFSYWATSYWGGSVAATGGAMVLGALPRIMKRPTVSLAICLGFGLAILANSRPFEGLVFSLPVGITLFVWIFKQNKFSLSQILYKIVVPVALFLTVTACAMGYYFWRVTGDPLRMPYQVHTQTYQIDPALYWQDYNLDLVYRHESLRNFYVGWALPRMERRATFLGFAFFTLIKVFKTWKFFILIVLGVALLFLPGIVRDKRMRIPMLVACFSVIGAAFSRAFHVHYIAPMTGLIFLLVVQCIRNMRFYTRGGKQIGLAAIRMLVLASVLIVFTTAGVMAFQYPSTGWARERVRIIKKLEDMGGQHLIVVKYSPYHFVLEEWVYNEPDIDKANVVWAREMGPEKDRPLIQYFSDRSAWLLYADDMPPRLIPYPHTDNGS